jgi:hypothetical protein
MVSIFTKSIHNMTRRLDAARRFAQLGAKEFHKRIGRVCPTHQRIVCACFDFIRTWTKKPRGDTHVHARLCETEETGGVRTRSRVDNVAEL